MSFRGEFIIALRKYPKAAVIPALQTLFEAWTRLDCVYLLTHPRTPNLMESGVRYVREGAPEIWKDIPTILEDGEDDCEGLACWLAAELRVRRGVPSAVVSLERQPGGRVIHAVVTDPASGRRWDPSVDLGMHSRSRKRRDPLPPLVSPPWRGGRRA